MWRVALERIEDWGEGEEKIPIFVLLVLLHPNADKKRDFMCTLQGFSGLNIYSVSMMLNSLD